MAVWPLKHGRMLWKAATEGLHGAFSSSCAKVSMPFTIESSVSAPRVQGIYQRDRYRTPLTGSVEVLKLRSPVFKAMLTGEMREANTRSIELKQVDPAVPTKGHKRHGRVCS